MFVGRRRPAPRHLAGARRPPAHAAARTGWWSALSVDAAATADDELCELEADSEQDRPRVESHRLAFAVASTFAALPILVVDNLPLLAEDPGTVEVAADPAGGEPPEASAPVTALTVEVTTTTPTSTTSTTSTTTPEPATTTAAPPPAEVDAAAVAEPEPAPDPPPTTTSPPPPPPPTTEAPPPPTTEAPPPPPAHQQSGQASWYRQPPRYEPRGCAHRTLPFGTHVTVTATRSGRTTTCTVNDRGPFVSGRIIDLDDEVFAELAPLSRGVVDVTITW